MIPLLFEHPPAFYVAAVAVMSILFMLIAFGHAILGLLRNARRYRSDGRSRDALAERVAFLEKQLYEVGRFPAERQHRAYHD